ncbi:MAG TPA: hypothetical protein DCE56_04180 [Cyanobacteria bacterium UBA8553]|nr:hypothetical protein [Cyanobacteria bacterium UBA8553]HAJ64193.1 hypothetical protein [Cyanobacteria bacterium UBA8543]
MNRLISGLQNFLVRLSLTTALIGVALGFSATFIYNGSSQAQAEPLTPEATKYEVNSQDSPFRDNEQQKVNQLFEENKQPQTASETTKKIGENLTKTQKVAKQSIESIANNVREKTERKSNEQKNKPTVDAKDVFENVKEKLNLDQPIDPGTKQFLNDVQNKAEETVKGTQKTVKDATS